MLENLQLDDAARRRLETRWERSMTGFHGQKPFFLEDAYLREAIVLAGIPGDFLPELRHAAQTVCANSDLLQFAWHVNYMLIHEEDVLSDYPDLRECDSGMFYLLMALSLMGPIRERYREKGIPEEYLICCRRVEGYRQTYMAGFGRPGLNKTQIHWIRHYLRLRCFRVGRLEYMFTDNTSYNVQAFRRRRTGEIRAMIGNNHGRVDRDGWLLLHSEDDSNAVLSGTYIKTATVVSGIGFRPDGRAELEPVTLPFDEWEQALAPGDRVLGLHIPEGGGLTVDKCRDSLQEALRFFDRYFPEYQAKAVCCLSWIFWSWYMEAMPESNIANFQRRLHLYPGPSRGDDGEYFIFGRTDKRFSEYLRDNSMRRLMLDLLESGRPLRLGGMFLLRDEIPRFGTVFTGGGQT